MDTVTPTQLVYGHVVIGKPAPRDDKNNLIIAIQLDNQQWKATFLCGHEESVGAHKQRKVRFTASEHCTLHFTNETVFNTEEKELRKGESQSLVVDDSTHNQWTECWITPGTTTAADPHRTPPKIVVP